MPFAASEGCRIYFRLEGSPDKPLVVLVHALGTDHAAARVEASEGGAEAFRRVL